MKTNSDLGLVADIGGTNCRFALVERGCHDVGAPVKFACDEHSDFSQVVRAYLNNEGKGAKPNWAIIAVAGPVDRDVVSLTNRNWRISGPDLAAQFGMREVRLVNDFAALARSTPFLDRAKLVALGGGEPLGDGGVSTTAIVGAGTGLGVGGLVSSPYGSAPLTTEGGHSTFAPGDDLERDIDKVLRARFGRVSNERLLCGEGLLNLHAALSEIEGVAPVKLTPSDVTARAAAASDPISVRVMQVFSRVMGAFAGDVVLMMGARAGCFVAGGLVPATLDVFDRDAFRARFEAKGRFSGYMHAAPAWIVTEPYAGLVGAAAFADTLIAAPTGASNAASA